MGGTHTKVGRTKFFSDYLPGLGDVFHILAFNITDKSYSVEFYSFISNKTIILRSGAKYDYQSLKDAFPESEIINEEITKAKSNFFAYLYKNERETFTYLITHSLFSFTNIKPLQGMYPIQMWPFYFIDDFKREFERIAKVTNCEELKKYLEILIRNNPRIMNFVPGEMPK
jgi:hypothetical protein